MWVLPASGMRAATTITVAREPKMATDALGFIMKPSFLRSFLMNRRVDSKYVCDELRCQDIVRCSMRSHNAFVKHQHLVSELQREIQVVSNSNHQHLHC